MTASVPGPAGTIYDLGYRGYDGPRLGRRHAVTALVTHGLRAAFGIGRGARSKIAPFGILALALIPVVVQVAIGALGAEQFQLIRYDNFPNSVHTLLALFCAAQAPELVGRDQRHSVLSLYFTRAIRRSDYALAKLLALVGALLVVLLVPQVMLFLGRIMNAADVGAAVGRDLPSLPPILATALLAAFGLAGPSLAIASFTPRRAWAVGAIITALVVSSGIAGVVSTAAEGDLARHATLVGVLPSLEGATAWLFGGPPNDPAVAAAGLPGAWYAAVIGGLIAVSTIVLVRRYRRIVA